MPVQTNRREFLLTAAGGAALSSIALASPAPLRPARDGRAIIQIVMTGGPSGIDTWDPKPDASVDIRGPFRPISTRIPGVYLSELFPRLAARMDRFALIRSLYHSAPPIHETGLQLIQTGKLAGEQAAPHVGAVAAANSEPTDIPTWVILPGPLGDTGVDLPQGQCEGGLVQANRPLHGALGSISGIEAPAKYRSSPFGIACYQALGHVKAGVRFVTVNMFPGVFDQLSWDMHASSNRLFVSPREYRNILGPMFDTAVSALLDDLSSTGLLNSTLLVAGGEMGRTPFMNSSGGRDHWTRCWSTLVAGGGIQGGRVLGKTTPDGGDVADRPVEAGEVASLMSHHLGLTTALRATDEAAIPSNRQMRPLIELF